MTVSSLAVPAVIAPVPVTRKDAATSGSTVNEALEPEVRLFPLVRVAVMLTPLSALSYVTPLMVTELLPAVIVPVSVPPKVPAPVFRLKLTPVSTNTFRGVLASSCDCTTTSKPVPAIGFVPPFTEVMASFVGTGSANKAKLKGAELTEDTEVSKAEPEFVSVQLVPS